MRVPANQVFSAKYRLYGIFGALGLLDQGLCWESDMVQEVRWRWDVGGGRDRRWGGGASEAKSTGSMGKMWLGL